MPNQQQVDEPDPVLGMERLDFPEHVAKGILEPSCNVFESPPFLGHVSWLPRRVDKLAEITISLLCECSISRFNIAQ